MKVPAPKGYHWMKNGNNYKLMKDPTDGYKPHKGASKSANFEVQKVHKGKQEATMPGYGYPSTKPKKKRKVKKPRGK